MTELFTSQLIKYTTDTLKTLPLAVLNFYVNGTTTPKAVYEDKYKVTSFGVSVTADSAGNFPQIWLDGTYRVELKNSAGITQTGWPVDDVGGSVDLPFDEWSEFKTYNNLDLVVETIPADANSPYRYESLQDNNINFRPSENPTKWRRIYFNTVAALESGSQVGSSGVTTTGCTILNGQQIKLFFNSENAVGLLNILSFFGVTKADGCYFVSVQGTITEIADPTTTYVVGSSPGAGKIGIYTDAIHSVFIKNNTGSTVTAYINVNGVYVSEITDNA